MKKILIISFVCFITLFVFSDLLINKSLMFWLEKNNFRLIDDLHFEMDSKIFALINSLTIIISFFLTKNKKVLNLIYFSILQSTSVTLFVFFHLSQVSIVNNNFSNKIFEKFNSIAIFYNNLSLITFELYGILFFYLLFIIWQIRAQNLVFFK